MPFGSLPQQFFLGLQSNVNLHKLHLLLLLSDAREQTHTHTHTHRLRFGDIIAAVIRVHLFLWNLLPCVPTSCGIEN